MSQIPMTVQGAQRLRDELQELKTVKRPAIVIAIAEARAHGDLKENAEYHAAREQQGFCEGRIQDIEANQLFKERIEERKKHTLHLLFEGKILESGTPEVLAANEMVRKVYLGSNFVLRKKNL
mgnify:CR=1 FL=1